MKVISSICQPGRCVVGAQKQKHAKHNAVRGVGKFKNTLGMILEPYCIQDDLYSMQLSIHVMHM